MPIANQMTKLLNKIERRLGTRVLNLPDELKKEKWAEVICEDTLDTFSRYFPRKYTVFVDGTSKRTEDGYYLIDEFIPDNVTLIGIRDINWSLFSQDSIRTQCQMGLGIYDYLAAGMGLDDAALLSARADMMSFFNDDLYIDYIQPNKFKIEAATGAELLRTVKKIPIDVFIKHSDNLMTIAPTKMETFEALAQADVARYLLSELKYFDNLETVYTNIDLKIADLENEASKREEIVERLKEGYVTAANDDQPIMYTV